MCLTHKYFDSYSFKLLSSAGYSCCQVWSYQIRSLLESLGKGDQVQFFMVFSNIKTTHKVKTSHLQERVLFWPHTSVLQSCIRPSSEKTSINLQKRPQSKFPEGQWGHISNSTWRRWAVFKGCKASPSRSDSFRNIPKSWKLQNHHYTDLPSFFALQFNVTVNLKSRK